MWAAGYVEKDLGIHDPSLAVIDEFIGMNVALVGIAQTVPLYAAAFILFRFFDIAKPFPICYLEHHLPGGIGIIMDDVVAGCMALGVLWAGCALLGYW
jgi:phosphatidylglycerophosphatase A